MAQEIMGSKPHRNHTVSLKGNGGQEEGIKKLAINQFY